MGLGEMLPCGFRRKEKWAELVQGRGVCVCVSVSLSLFTGGPLHVTIYSHDEGMAEVSLVDFDGEAVKALNRPRGKTLKQRDYLFFGCLIKCKKYMLLAPAFCFSFTYHCTCWAQESGRHFCFFSSDF